MRKKLAKLLAITLSVLTVAASAVSVSAAETTDSAKAIAIWYYIPTADVNFDGTADLDDLLITQKYVAKLVELDENQLASADMNQDKAVEVEDVLFIQKILANLVDNPIDLYNARTALRSDLDRAYRLSFTTMADEYGLSQDIVDLLIKTAEDIYDLEGWKVQDAPGLSVPLYQRASDKLHKYLFTEQVMRICTEKKIDELTIILEDVVNPNDKQTIENVLENLDNVMEVPEPTNINTYLIFASTALCFWTEAYSDRTLKETQQLCSTISRYLAEEDEKYHYLNDFEPLKSLYTELSAQLSEETEQEDLNEIYGKLAGAQYFKIYDSSKEAFEEKIAEIEEIISSASGDTTLLQEKLTYAKTALEYYDDTPTSARCYALSEINRGFGYTS